MKTISISEFRNQVSELIGGKHVVLVTRYGKPAAILVPLKDPQTVPMEVRRDLFFDFSQKMSRALKTELLTEEDILNEFAESKKSRGGL